MKNTKTEYDEDIEFIDNYIKNLDPNNKEDKEVSIAYKNELLDKKRAIG